jgi:hypothetical protein
MRPFFYPTMRIAHGGGYPQGPGACYEPLDRHVLFNWRNRDGKNQSDAGW